MGAWGAGIYENDDACDFANEVASGPDLSRVSAALNEVLSAGKEYLEAPLAAEGLAAADVVARLCGQWGECDSSTKEIDEWVHRVKLKPSDGLLKKAKQVVQRVRTPPSELLELWSESGDGSEWLGSLDELMRRLS